jgi:hypothetical protein
MDYCQPLGLLLALASLGLHRFFGFGPFSTSLPLLFDICKKQ